MLRISDLVRGMFRRAARAPRPARPIHTRLNVESLEGRDVPVNLTVTPLGDVTEGGTLTFRVTRDGSTASTQWFLMNTSGTATSGSDYTALTSSYGQIASGAAYADVTISTTNDSTSEATETLTLNVSPYPPATTWSSGTANILDNDGIVVSVAKVSDAAEGGADGVFRFTRIGDLSGSLTANFSGGGTATSGTDFTSLGTTVTFAANAATADAKVAALPDNLIDPDETVTATATTGTGYTVGSPSSATVTIADDPPLISVAWGADAHESGDDGDFTLTRTGGDVSSALTVSYSVGGTATAGTNYTTLSGSVTFAAGKDTAHVSVSALEDGTADDDLTVSITVGDTSTYLAGASDSDTVTIFDSTAQSFTVDGYQGEIWYDIPWDEVDFDASSQSLVLSDFSLKLAGHTFTASNAQSAPTIQFANGEPVGITFDIDTSGVTSYPFTSLSMSGWNFTAVPPVGDPFIVADAPERSQLTIDFKDAGGNPLAYNLTVKVETQSGTIANKTFQVAASTSAEFLRDSVYGVLKDIKGLEVEWISDTRMIVKGTKNDQLVRVRFDGNAIQQLTAIKGRAVATATVTPKLNIRGADQ